MRTAVTQEQYRERIALKIIQSDGDKSICESRTIKKCGIVFCNMERLQPKTKNYVFEIGIDCIVCIEQ